MSFGEFILYPLPWPRCLPERGLARCTTARQCLSPAHKGAVNSAGSHVYETYALIQRTVLPLMLCSSLASFGNHSQNPVKPPERIGSDQTDRRKCLFPWAFLTTAEEMQSSQLLAGRYISDPAPSPSLCSLGMGLLSCGPTINRRQEDCVPALPKDDGMLFLEKCQIPLPSSDIEWRPFRHLPHKLCYQTGYCFAFGVNSWVCIFLAQQPHQRVISAGLPAVLHGLLLGKWDVQHTYLVSICVRFFLVSSLLWGISCCCLLCLFKRVSLLFKSLWKNGNILILMWSNL